MKVFCVLATVCAIFAGRIVADDDFCYNTMLEACSKSAFPDSECNATFSGFLQSSKHLQSYANHQIEKSFDFLLLAANFGSYVKNRPGFEKQFRELSDRAWNDGIDTIKKITQRGGSHDFQYKDNLNSINTTTLGLDELQAISFALDVEKELAREAHNLHRIYTFRHKDTKSAAGLEGEKQLAIQNHSASHKTSYDPEITFWLEEHFFENQVATIRKLSGYVNDIKELIKSESDKSLALYLFDDYLKSQ